jgi:GNAT superfamily N-acetyltransferase
MKLVPATSDDVLEIVALRIAVAERLTLDHGQGPWSSASSAKRVLSDMRNATVFVARQRGKLAASLLLTTRKPWAIDRSYFGACQRPLYLLSMAVAPDQQRQGIGRTCMAEVATLCRQWPADALRLDSYDAPAGAGAFYRKCGMREVGRTTYRRCPLIYFELTI